MKKKIIALIISILIIIGFFIVDMSNETVTPEIRVHLGAGTIVMEQEELSLSPSDTIMLQANTVYLPLQPIVEKLGYKISRAENSQEVSLIKGTTIYKMIIGSNKYLRKSQTVTLLKPPILIQGKVLVPVMFFTDVMNKTVEVSNSHV